MRDGFKEVATVMADVVGRTEEEWGREGKEQRKWTPVRMDGQKGFSDSSE